MKRELSKGEAKSVAAYRAELAEARRALKIYEDAAAPARARVEALEADLAEVHADIAAARGVEPAAIVVEDAGDEANERLVIRTAEEVEVRETKAAEKSLDAALERVTERLELKLAVFESTVAPETRADERRNLADRIADGEARGLDVVEAKAALAKLDKVLAKLEV